MLDQETKKKINNLRDTLVGKVPDPKSQVEQIMIALIYKFMNDMDKESTDLGGEASFFVGDFEKYSWDNLFGTKVSGSELVDLYSTAVESMEENPNIPQLFRDIFKNAYIPYKDAETLRLFLSQIDDFEYSKDSEQLGDAFEHILNSLSSQGDAGQFRTPRHIIDFIVEIIDPKKDETVLDPASGTSGFLISAFKHIVNSNSEKSIGDLLSATQRKKIMENINGYDISPDMVRIGLANMYLHGFPEPNVVEYDALTSEDRWNEYYDVILANPPFMTPKGGIRPHNKFGVKSNKAEVLFVDYILTHLKPKGRAGIIVPEGIIFQSGKAYKELRKKLIENGLTGVVSLPSGVFNPYSGVKTSILIIDKSKSNNQIFFGTIENDGFSLGAQRNQIEGSQIPHILKLIKSQKTINENNFLFVKKKEISENSYQLTSNTYLKKGTSKLKNYVSLLDISELVRGVTYSKKDQIEKGSGHKILRANNIDLNSKKLNYENLVLVNKDLKFSENKILKKDDILICTASGSKEHIGKVGFSPEDTNYYFGGFMGVLRTQENVLPKFLFYILANEQFNDYLRDSIYGASINNLNKRILEGFRFPLPPLEKQQKIVDEIEQYQKVIDGAMQVVVNYKPTFSTEENSKAIEIGELCTLTTGGTPKTGIKDYYNPGTIKWLVSGDIHATEIFDCEGRISELGMKESNAKFLPENSVLIALNGQGKTRGSVALLRTKATCNQSLVSIMPNNSEELLSEYLFLCLKNMYMEIRNLTGHKDRRGLNMPIIKKIKIPLVSIETQKEIVESTFSEIESVRKLDDIISSKNDEINNLINSLYK